MKKDPNYLAGLEKAIKEKYGQEAIQNPKANWDDDKEKEYTTPGKPEVLYNADGDAVKTNNIDEGNLSETKTESGTNRRYVEYLEGNKAGGRLYFSNPK